MLIYVNYFPQCLHLLPIVLQVNELRVSAKGIEHISSRLQVQYHKAQNDINDTYNFYRAMLEERKQVKT